MPPEENAAVVDPLIGMLVDERYRVTSRLARGGMASVYVADDERLDRPVALKVMHPHLADSADFVARFRREARSAARIVHPGVVSVFDQGVVAGQGFLVMELIEGTNLRRELRARGSFTVARSLTIIQEILEALGAAHRVGVIHRDIKPENVLMDHHGRIRVTDFGLARAASETSFSSTGTMLGTVSYVAPEMLTRGEADARTDVYSVGVMLYEMLTGTVPWAQETAIQVAMHHANDDIPAPSQAQPWLPTEIDDLVAALTARDPDSRPTVASEAVELVARTAAALPEDIAQRSAEIEPVGDDADDCHTDRLEPLQATQALPASVRAGAQTTVHTAPSQHAPVTLKKKRKKLIVLIVVLLALVAAGSASAWWWWNEYGPGAYLQVPQLSGMTLEEAQSTLDGLGIRSLTDVEFSDDVETGKVITTDPPGGGSVHKNGEVRLVVSKGVDMRVVPDLVEATRDAAEEALATAGLAVGAVTEEWSESIPLGSVISQSVAPSSLLKHDEPVDFVVSKGREPIPVPELVSLTADQARAALEALGLVANPSEDFSETVAAGVVISQGTAAHTELHRGDTVSYVVSKGPPLVEVPNVFGSQRDVAKQLLENAGFQVQVEALLGGVFGTVRSTDPEAGTLLPKGSVVTLKIV
nr:Stk1 family PASTA domain-containing Ser/Thr kinase [Schaalia suimastitidis]